MSITFIRCSESSSGNALATEATKARKARWYNSESLGVAAVYVIGLLMVALQLRSLL